MVGFFLFRFFVAIFWFCPFWLLYFLSDILSFLLYYVFRYRIKVVEGNLLAAFPQKTDDERRLIAKKFYTHFSDLCLEGIKGFSMTDKQLLNRFFGTNISLINDYMDTGKSALLLAGHYGNWEWAVAACGIQAKHTLIGLYKPLNNKKIEQWVKQKRERCGLVLASIGTTPETFEQYKAQPTCYIMLGDQNPSNPNLAHWTNFLNQDTACLHGPDKYARKTGYAVFYAEITKVKRGYYRADLELLSSEQQPLYEAQITEIFMKRVEKTILAAPEFWLWTHRRWKHKR